MMGRTQIKGFQEKDTDENIRTKEGEVTRGCRRLHNEAVHNM